MTALFVLLLAHIIGCEAVFLDRIAKICYNYNVYLCAFVNGWKFDDLI